MQNLFFGNYKIFARIQKAFAQSFGNELPCFLLLTQAKHVIEIMIVFFRTAWCHKA
jgi:hypothetical protein